MSIPRDPVKAPSHAIAPPYVAAIRVSCGSRRQTGSGVLVDPHHVVTCVHVLADIDPNNAEAPPRRSFDEAVASGWSANMAGTVIAVSAGLDRFATTSWRRARYFAEDRTNDVALLRLERPIHGVAPPLIHANRRPGEHRLAFGHQNDGIDRVELRIASDAVRYGERSQAPSSITHDLGLSAGYSGGPLVAVDEHGRHWLDGISAMGGNTSPIGVAAGMGPVMALLAEHMSWRPADVEDPRTDPPPAGVAPRFALPLGGFEAMEFRWSGAFFRASLPISAACHRRLRGESERVGGDRLAAHLADAAAAKDCLALLESASGARLRLPTVAELAHLADADAQSAPQPFAGNLPTLAAFVARVGSLASPPGTAEWATDRGEVRCVVRRQVGGLVSPLDQFLREEGRQPHLRLALRPLFRPD